MSNKRYFRAKDAVIAGLIAAFYGDNARAAKHLADATEQEDFQDMVQDMDQQQQQAMGDEGDMMETEVEQQVPVMSTLEKRVVAQLAKKGFKLVKAEDQSDDEEQDEEQQEEMEESSLEEAESNDVSEADDEVKIEPEPKPNELEVSPEGSGRPEQEAALAAAMRAERAKRNKKRLGL